MQTKSTKPKSERPAAGQNRSATATKRSRAASEPGLTQAATLTTGLLAENGDLTPLETAASEITAPEVALSEPAATEAEAVPVGAAPDNAQPLALTTEIPADDEVSTIPESGDAAPAEQPSEFVPTVEAKPSVEAEPIAEPTAEPLAPAAPVGETTSNAALPPTRAGLVQSPLAARMLAEASERRSSSRSGKSGRSSRTIDHSLGEEFALADARVKSLKAQLTEARSRVQGAVDPAISAQLTALRSQIRAARGSKIEGVAPFDLAIATAREALNTAKTAKRGFLASQGLGVSGPTSAGPSLRQQLQALRSRIREGASAAESAELAQLRADYRAAKSDRKAAREKALAPLPNALSNQPEADAPQANDESATNETINEETVTVASTDATA